MPADCESCQEKDRRIKELERINEDWYTKIHQLVLETQEFIEWFSKEVTDENDSPTGTD